MEMGSPLEYLLRMERSVTRLGLGACGPLYTVSSGWIDAMCLTCALMTHTHELDTSYIRKLLRKTRNGAKGRF